MQVKSYKAGNVGHVEIDESRLHDKSGKARVLYRTLKDAIVMHQANQRQGNAYTRGRDEVVGSNKKPWKQKHTGRARAGDRKSPIWRGGGTLFGPKTRDWSYHMPAKARRVAARTALFGKLRDGEVVIADLDGFASPSAKAARKVLADLGKPRRALIVIEQHDEALWKSFRNFPGVQVRTAAEVCAFDLVASALVIAQPAAMEKLTQRIGKSAESAGGCLMTSMDRSYQITSKPLLSEKSYDPDHGRYSFRVPRDANKVEIRQAIERLFEVKVKSINTLSVKGKWKVRGRSIGRTQEWKKAMVVLEKGQTIDVL